MKRLIPAIQDTYQQVLQINFHYATFDKIIKDLMEATKIVKKKEINHQSHHSSDLGFHWFSLGGPCGRLRLPEQFW